ncbi:MAG: Asp23/Gls24 family envelope stress response protein [Clostridiales bacterium]|nr:Asp23/Gls24 family envelope stress response protein [Clostridiales bacterium]MBQ2817562.1 Asp23/Gls24 family envelope stress response protein [Clostridia bacterium]
MTDNHHLPVSLPEQKAGSVTFADDVIAIIAGIAATDVEGVAGMSGGISSGISDMLGRKNLTKGVKVEVGSEQVAVDLYLVINYGVRIIEVSKNVQENVKKAIEDMTGLSVVEVNVHVLGVKIEKEPAVVPSEPAEPAPQPRVK